MVFIKVLISLIVLSPISIIVYFWYSTASFAFGGNSGDILSAIGRLFGLLLAFAVLLQLFLRSRISLLEKTVGFGFMNRIHKKNGYVVFVLLILHPLFLVLGYSQLVGNSLFTQLFLFLFTYQGVFKAFLALLIFLFVITSSIYMVRKKLPYELWYLIHLSTYIAILFAWDHQLTLGTDFAGNEWFVRFWYVLYIIVIGSILYWRIFRILFSFYTHKFFIAKVVKEATDTYSVYIEGKDLQKFHFIPGQFAFLRFLTKQTWFESHPFSFSQTNKHKSLRFTIKNSGNFTSIINQIPQGTNVLLDGPHGVFTLPEKPKRKLLFLAGGVGITPIRSLLEYANQKDAVLLYANKVETDIIFKSELEELAKSIGFKIEYVVSRNPKYQGLKGRITIELIKQRVPDFMKRDIFICGPRVMIDELVASLSPVVSKSQIHTEVFEL